VKTYYVQAKDEKGFDVVLKLMVHSSFRIFINEISEEEMENSFLDDEAKRRQKTIKELEEIWNQKK
jgi:hypothetical protein